MLRTSLRDAKRAARTHSRAALDYAGSKHDRSKHDRALSLEVLRVFVKKTMPKPKLAERPLQSSGFRAAWKGTRKVLWGSSKGEARIYDWEALQPGNRVEGCAILEDANTTYFVPKGWTMEMDRFGNATLTREAKKT